MIYIFGCPRCGETKEIDMKVVEYEKMKEDLTFPFCKCGLRMNRVYTPTPYFYDLVAERLK